MRKILLMALIMFFVGSVSAASVFGGHEFTDWSDFDGMFEKIYLDTARTDNKVICGRVLEWPQFINEEGERIFSLKDCLSFAEEGSLTNFTNVDAGSRTNVDTWINLMSDKFDFEKELWEQEESLKRELSLDSIWTDGDSGGKTSTSPIDLVVTWNEIDEMLHGEKATYPDYMSGKESEDDIFEIWSWDGAPDDWLSQDEGSLASPSDYPDGEASFAGGLEEQMRNFNDIASNSLVPGEAVQQTFGVPFHGSPIPTSLQMNVDTVPSVPESPDESEQLAVKEEDPFADMEGVFNKLFEEQSVVELRETDEDSSRSDWLYDLFTVETDKADKEFADNIDELFLSSSETRLSDLGQEEVLPLQQWNIILDTWIDNLEKWEGTTELFLDNPKS